ncbi:MAG TPA: PAS domain S-box protein, partial [Candidatus Nanopelagicales bacterium]|nr:PAS domain S-box protein [Candidatus Nanopelagicales bacterium]
MSLDPSFHAFLAARRAQLVDDFADGVTVRVPFYRRQPKQTLTPRLVPFVDAVLEALRASDVAGPVEVVSARLAPLSLQGMSFEDALEIVATFRKAALEHGLAAFVAGVPGAREGMGFLEDVSDAIVRRVGAYYRDALGAAERAVSEIDARHRDLFAQMPVMMHSIDEQGRLVDVNDLWLKAFGYAREEVIGRRSVELLAEDSVRYAREVVMPAFFQTGRTENVVYQFVRKDGSVMHVLLSAVAERDAEGRFLRSRAVLIDVSEHVHTARALEESEARYRGLVELSPDAVAVIRRGRLLYVNRAGAQVLGCDDPASLLGRRAAEFVDPIHADSVPETDSSAPLPLGEARLLRLTGERVMVELSGAPILYEGEPAFQVVFRDVTARRRVEEADRRSALQEETIRTQRDLLRALSTPLVPLGKGVILMPLVGAMDAARADQMMSVLLDGVAAYRARFAIL